MTAPAWLEDDTEEFPVATVEMPLIPHVPTGALPRPDEPCLGCGIRMGAIELRPDNPARAPRPVFMESGAIGYTHYMCAGRYRHEGPAARVESLLRGTSDPSAK